MEIIVRQETSADYENTKEVVRRAFAEAEHTDHMEHELIGRLRHSHDFIPELSLVAVEQASGDIVGHILLSKIFIKHDKKQHVALALAPLSVLPEYQKQGVGGALIEKALEKAKMLGYSAVVVLGHSAYYPKYGFRKASEWGITSPFPVPDKAFMAVELQDHALEGVSGVVAYDPAFFA